MYQIALVVQRHLSHMVVTMAEPNKHTSTQPLSPPPWLSSIAEDVEKRLERLFQAETKRWSAVDSELELAFKRLSELTLAGGKRLRPAFCHWGFVGAGGNPSESILTDVGAAFELLHAFALIHDDVMDGSQYRRGLHTIHQQYATQHGLKQWKGESRRFGEGVAILIGDLAFVYADTLMAGTDKVVKSLYDEMRIEINIGQYLDMLGSAQSEISVTSTRRISLYKSAKYTIERPLHIGAGLNGRFNELADSYSAYGLPLGEAFQLRDDVLGAFGNSNSTGKPVGDDLIEGKPTLLLALAREQANSTDVKLLDRVGANDISGEEIEKIQEILISTGALEKVEALITSLTDQAVGAIQNAPIEEDARMALIEIAPFVSWRDR